MQAMNPLIQNVRRHWLWLALAASAALLVTVNLMERIGGLVPCPLCLDQRKVYWAAMAVAAVGLLLRATPLRRRFDWLFALVLVAVFLTGLFIAGRHAGIEFGWLPPLEKCGGGTGKIDLEAMAGLASGKTNLKVVPCDEVQWRWLGLSMAGWNVLISAGLASLSAFAALDRTSRRPVHA
jgi:disulfide bond formation protein DsbB